MADKLVFHTSVVAMPPPEICAPIIDIKRNHMNPRIKRPPFAHITLLAPFVDVPYFDEAEARLREALKGVTPFEVDIRELSFFKNNKSSTLYIEPVPSQDPHAFERLYGAVSGAFPACKEAGNGFEPHIGVGYFQGADHAKIAQEYQRKYQSTWQPVSFPLKEVYILSRTGQDTPFEVRRVISLGEDKSAPFHVPVLL